MAKIDKIQLAYDELAWAVETFKEAIIEFKRTYNPNTVDLLAWQEGLDDTMFEISEDIEVEMERK
jgi:hypothetical protein